MAEGIIRKAKLEADDNPESKTYGKLHFAAGSLTEEDLRQMDERQKNRVLHTWDICIRQDIPEEDRPAVISQRTGVPEKKVREILFAD